MYVVIAENRYTHVLEYVSPPLTNAQANELASALRRHTTLRVSIESPAALERLAARPLH